MPYSGSANPTLHLFVHLIGCAYHIKRSLNALLVEPKGVKSVLSNVFLFVYAHERTKDLDPQYYEEEEQKTVDIIRKYYKKMAALEREDMEGKTAADQAEAARDEERQKEQKKDADPGTGDEVPGKDDFDEEANADGDYYDYEELIKMFAILGMYFNVFPKSPYAKIRVGTIILSYKDCSALASNY